MLNSGMSMVDGGDGGPGVATPLDIINSQIAAAERYKSNMEKQGKWQQFAGASAKLDKYYATRQNLLSGSTDDDSGEEDSGESGGQESTPPTPTPIPSSAKTAAVKIATPDIVRAAREVPTDQALITTILLNDIGGQELISISRSDLINGQNVSYQPISDAKKAYLDYNPTNIVYLPQTLDKTLDGFPIKLNSKIPTSVGNNVLFNDNKLVVKLKDIQPDELVEIQVVSSGTLLDDTIYTGE